MLVGAQLHELKFLTVVYIHHIHDRERLRQAGLSKTAALDSGPQIHVAIQSRKTKNVERKKKERGSEREKRRGKRAVLRASIQPSWLSNRSARLQATNTCGIIETCYVIFDCCKYMQRSTVSILHTTTYMWQAGYQTAVYGFEPQIHVGL